jgi:hypothetical protein
MHPTQLLLRKRAKALTPTANGAVRSSIAAGSPTLPLSDEEDAAHGGSSNIVPRATVGNRKLVRHRPAVPDADVTSLSRSLREALPPWILLQ